MNMFDPSLFGVGTGVATILVSTFVIRYILKQDSGTERMREISSYIVAGTNAYLKRQIKTISFVMPFLSILVFLLFNWQTAISFLFGVTFSIIAGYIGMNVAVRANVRTANAALTSSAKTLKIAFFGGSVMGLLVPGLSLLGLYLLRLVFNDLQTLVGFGFGASLAALFSQIGGGIYTKSADIGADLVGKVEEEIPEDDPRNPAVIADLVGDNVGDCAGRGSDLFQSFSDDIITGMIMGTAFIWRYGNNAVIFPFLMEAMGILACMAGIFIVKGRKGINPIGSLFISLMVAAFTNTIGLYFLITLLLNDFTLFIAGSLGLGATLIAILTTLYYTGLGHKPIKQIAEFSQRGPAINVMMGVSLGLRSPILPIIAVLAAIVLSFTVSGQSLYALVITNIGTDLMIGFIMSSDAFGPITDNAAGIAEMAGVSAQTGEILSHLDAVGNTMKASTKAYAMVSGTVTSFVIFATYFIEANINSITVSNPFALAAFFLGVALPFPFSSLTINATTNGALKMVDEVRRQFKEIVGLREGKAKPDYSRCIDISTTNALKGMIAPGLIAIATPIIVGILFGAYTLGMLLVGATSSSAILGFFFNNAGASLDNAKKFVESGYFGGKNSETHKATVVGDTIGDTMKDVAGPSVLIFMKLLGMTALLILPSLMLI